MHICEAKSEMIELCFAPLPEVPLARISNFPYTGRRSLSTKGAFSLAPPDIYVLLRGRGNRDAFAPRLSVLYSVSTELKDAET